MLETTQVRNRFVGRRRPKGAIVVLAAILLVVFVALLAFAIDVGYLCMVRSQAQHCADATALAAALEMTSNDNLKKKISQRMEAAVDKAFECAALQDVNRSLVNSGNERTTSVVESIRFGRLEDIDNPNEPISFVAPGNPNVVVVQITCDPERGTAIPLFFAKIFGLDTEKTSVTAVAAFSLDRTTGFNSEGNTPCTLMPFVIDEDDWNNFIANGGEDNWSYDPKTKTVSSGPDGIPELKLFPETEDVHSGMITPGNFGTVNIGESAANPAEELRRQIVEGPSEADMAVYDGILRLDEVTNTLELTGAADLELNGDPGISASIQSALDEIIGHPKTIMLYNHAEGAGNNAQFTISGFVGVRVMDQKLTGALKRKYVMIQPAMVQDSSAVVDSDSDTSEFVGQPVHLVR